MIMIMIIKLLMIIIIIDDNNNDNDFLLHLNNLKIFKCVLISIKQK